MIGRDAVEEDDDEREVEDEEEIEENNIELSLICLKHLNIERRSQTKL